MNFDYEAWLYNTIYQIISDLEYDVEFKISEEQMFVKDRDKKHDVLYIVYKQLTGPNSFGVATIPYNILVISEENQLEMAKDIANHFALENNFAIVKDGDSLIKHEYNQPSIMSNFNQIDIGVRSIIYIPATLTVMSGLVFLKYGEEYGVINAGGVNIKPLSFNLSYSMTPDTQALPTEQISQSKKSVSTLALSFVVPLYGNNTFLEDVLKVMKGTLTGNTSFNFKFTYGTLSYDLDMKLISATLEETPVEAPGLKLGFMV